MTCVLTLGRPRSGRSSSVPPGPTSRHHHRTADAATLLSVARTHPIRNYWMIGARRGREPVLGCGHIAEGAHVGQDEVSEGTVLCLWERYSGREMTNDECARAKGNKLVKFLQTFPEPVLMRSAFTAHRRGEDLDWASWRDWTIRYEKQRNRNKDKPVKDSRAASARTDRAFNTNPRRPSRYTTESGRASARAPGYSGGTLPHAQGKPSKHY